MKIFSKILFFFSLLYHTNSTLSKIDQYWQVYLKLFINSIKNYPKDDLSKLMNEDANFDQYFLKDQVEQVSVDETFLKLAEGFVEGEHKSVYFEYYQVKTKIYELDESYELNLDTLNADNFDLDKFDPFVKDKIEFQGFRLLVRDIQDLQKARVLMYIEIKYYEDIRLGIEHFIWQLESYKYMYDHQLNNNEKLGEKIQQKIQTEQIMKGLNIEVISVDNIDNEIKFLFQYNQFQFDIIFTADYSSKSIQVQNQSDEQSSQIVKKLSYFNIYIDSPIFSSQLIGFYGNYELILIQMQFVLGSLINQGFDVYNIITSGQVRNSNDDYYYQYLQPFDSLFDVLIPNRKDLDVFSEKYYYDILSIKINDFQTDIKQLQFNIKKQIQKEQKKEDENENKDEFEIKDISIIQMIPSNSEFNTNIFYYFVVQNLLNELDVDFFSLLFQNQSQLGGDELDESDELELDKFNDRMSIYIETIKQKFLGKPKEDLESLKQVQVDKVYPAALQKEKNETQRDKKMCLELCEATAKNSYQMLQNYKNIFYKIEEELTSTINTIQTKVINILDGNLEGKNSKSKKVIEILSQNDLTQLNQQFENNKQVIKMVSFTPVIQTTRREVITKYIQHRNQHSII